MKTTNITRQMETLEKYRSMKIQIDCLRDVYSVQLEREIKSLYRTLGCELNNIEKARRAGKVYRPNYRGIVQRAGHNIDELCIQLGILNSVDQA